MKKREKKKMHLETVINNTNNGAISVVNAVTNLVILNALTTKKKTKKNKMKTKNFDSNYNH